MKLGLAKIKTGENPFHGTAQDSWVRELVGHIGSQGTKVSDLDIQMVLTKLEPDYYLKGRMAFTVEQTCGRCAEPFSMPINHPFELGLAHIKNMASRKGKEEVLAEESEELDIQYFEGNDLDLGPILEEQIFLSLPYAPICQPGCRGICQICGADLNKGACRCQKTNPINAFSVLSRYKV